MSFNSTDYLSRLPEGFRYLGNHQKSEIEIVTDPKIVSSIVEKYEVKKQDSNLYQESCHSDACNVGIIFEDEYLLVVRDPVIFRNGNSGTYLRIFERSVLTGKAGVVILPVKDNLIYFNRIFRHATRNWELELPRGYREEEQSLENAVKTELLQEVGLKVKTVQDIGEIQSNTGILVGAAHAYFVTLQSGNAKPEPEESESIAETVMLTLAQVKEKICSGQIRDGFTLSALQLAQARDLLSL